MARERVRARKPAAVRLSQPPDAPGMGEHRCRIHGQDLIAGCAGIPFRLREVMPIDHC